MNVLYIWSYYSKTFYDYLYQLCILSNFLSKLYQIELIETSKPKYYSTFEEFGKGLYG